MSKVRIITGSLIYLTLSFYPDLTQDAIRKQLADDEEKDIATGTAFLMHEDISASHLISMGIDLEENQYVFCPLHSTAYIKMDSDVSLK